MVAGPKLLLMDEPCTGVNIFEIVVLLQTFREMVNQDRTVVATVHQPTAEEFKLFDSLLLLSKGRVIYHGPVANATNFFVASPFAFDYRNYTNPADYVTDISGCFISDSKGEFIDSSILENHYMQGDNFARLQTQIKNAFAKHNPTGASAPGDTENPLNKYGAGQASARTAGIEERASNFSDSGINPGHSIEIENAANPNGASAVTAPKKKPSYAWLLLQAIIDDTFAYPTWDNISNIGFKGWILIHRSILALAFRYELLISSNLVHLFLAILFGTIMGDSSGSNGIYNTTSFLAVGSMFLMVANVVFVFYMFNSSQVHSTILLKSYLIFLFVSQVFLKEYSRGLYSNFLRWLTTDYPLYLLRMINAIVFITVVFGMTNEPTSTGMEK